MGTKNGRNGTALVELFRGARHHARSQMDDPGEVKKSEASGAARLEFVALDRNRRLTIFSANQPAQGDQLQRKLIVKLRGPAYGELHALPLRQRRFGGEQNTPTAHVNGLAHSHLLDRLLSSEYLVADIPLNCHPI
jgi:hypothetical protein